MTMERKKPIKHLVRKEDYAWNPSMCACRRDKDCDMGLKDCTCMKSLADVLVVTCDEIVDTPDITSINSNYRTNYWLIATVLLTITCLLLLAVIVIKY